MDACEVIILDIRVPCTPVARLNNHRACVNGEEKNIIEDSVS